MHIATASQLAHYLVNAGLVNQHPTDLLQQCKTEGLTLIPWLYQTQPLPAPLLAKHIACCFKLKLLDLDLLNLNKLPTQVLNDTLIREHQVLPITLNDTQLTLALADPTCVKSLDTIKFHTGLDLKIVIAQPEQLKEALTRILCHNQYVAAQTPQPQADEDNAAPQVSHFIDQLFIDALSRQASDIHFECYASQYRIRMRVDGLLHIIATPAIDFAPRVTTRLKVLASLDITERRLPQDGRFTVTLPDHPSRECRISICPNIHGEKIVVRLLENHNTTLAVNALGLDSQQQQLFKQALQQPQGMILVTGPTGSGKTITLYTALMQLNSVQRNISTIEEPVEIATPGINQININPRIGLTFATALRALLRQDPDVIMIGEIRDLETAEIAIKAAQTGHLVLATLHTNSAVATINRLINLGIAPYNITEVVNLVVAQRLVRKLCRHCKTPQLLPREVLKQLGYHVPSTSWQLYQAQGCQHCTQGYQGRTGIFEVMPMVDPLVDTIINHNERGQIQTRLQQLGYATLQQSGFDKVTAGITSLVEFQSMVSQR